MRIFYNLVVKKDMKESQRRYYDTNRSFIIRTKTLQMVAARGRIPKQSTIDKHGLDRKEVECALYAYAERYPDTKAAKRIATLQRESCC